MGLLDMFGGGSAPKYRSNKDAFDRFAGEMDNMGNRYQGYVDTGNQARDKSFGEYQKLIDDPNFLQDMVAKGYSESPYQKMLLERTQKRMNMNSANTGMLGSGAANRALQDEMMKMGGAFQDQYIGRGMDSYKTGLSGLDRLTDLGFKGLGAQDNLWEQAAAGRLKGDMSENETQQRNAEAEAASKGRGIGNLIGLAGGVAGTMFGGPVGGRIGSSIGGSGGGGGGFSMSSLASMFGGGSGNNSGGFSPSNYSNGVYNSPPPPQQPAGGGGFNIGSWSF